MKGDGEVDDTQEVMDSFGGWEDAGRRIFVAAATQAENARLGWA